MSDKAEFIEACKKELERLKEEEAFIREILRDVQKQLGKYKVEALHMSHLNVTHDTREDKPDDDDDDDDDGDNELASDNLISAEMIDVPEIINKNKLNLELANESYAEEFEEDSDESELCD